ncbi:GDSL esterase/lipase [Rhynchospora pubera]|uniref:GDSL esterase/lipase n=1 Tax=Rhynchospora pubera TaxID=906938 RepID=A0AAV8C9L6_9POAL|nr:GDSL esterase/lipase [Rhynchospora pubera]
MKRIAPSIFSFLLFLLQIQPTKSYKYNSIFSFGDSYTDTGNLNVYVLSKNLSISVNTEKWPYGQTFFHHPADRFSDGRLILDFLAEEFCLPFVEAYLAKKGCFRQGANFAVAGATALDPTVLKQISLAKPAIVTALNTSLNFQLKWFKELKPSLCHETKECRKYFDRSFFVVGEIGLNDYNNMFVNGLNVTQVHHYVPKVVDTIGNAIKGLIYEGARTLLVPGNVPMGCLPTLLSSESDEQSFYDNRTGCIRRFNMLSRYHNSLLLRAIKQLRVKYPHAKIIYADYYKPLINFVKFPQRYGFTSTPLRVCCGKGGKYNWNSSELCGMPNVSACHDPSRYIFWDGVHLTEAAYHIIFNSWLKGPYAQPPIQDAHLH